MFTNVSSTRHFLLHVNVSTTTTRLTQQHNIDFLHPLKLLCVLFATFHSCLTCLHNNAYFVYFSVKTLALCWVYSVYKSSDCSLIFPSSIFHKLHVFLLRLSLTAFFMFIWQHLLCTWKTCYWFFTFLTFIWQHLCEHCDSLIPIILHLSCIAVQFSMVIWQLFFAYRKVNFSWNHLATHLQKAVQQINSVSVCLYFSTRESSSDM